MGSAYGRTGLGKNLRVNVEFVSANPTGPLHVGHTRGAVFGDALSELLSFAGYKVTREYYINDGGSQVDTLARSVYLRYLEAHGQEVALKMEHIQVIISSQWDRHLKKKLVLIISINQSITGWKMFVNFQQML